jgi:hypothetical protein
MLGPIEPEAEPVPVLDPELYPVLDPELDLKAAIQSVSQNWRPFDAVDVFITGLVLKLKGIDEMRWTL